jgi:hypothetical protein
MLISDRPVRVEICSGICGFVTVVEAVAQDVDRVTLNIQSGCRKVQDLAAELTEVLPYQEISLGGDGPLVYRLASQHLLHAACPVPVGIIKAVEVAAGLALPADATIRLSRLEFSSL